MESRIRKLLLVQNLQVEWILFLQGGNTGALFGGEKNATINVTATVNDDEVRDQFIAAT